MHLMTVSKGFHSHQIVNWTDAWIYDVFTSSFKANNGKWWSRQPDHLYELRFFFLFTQILLLNYDFQIRTMRVMRWLFIYFSNENIKWNAILAQNNHQQFEYSMNADHWSVRSCHWKRYKNLKYVRIYELNKHFAPFFMYFFFLNIIYTL